MLTSFKDRVSRQTKGNGSSEKSADAGAGNEARRPDPGAEAARPSGYRPEIVRKAREIPGYGRLHAMPGVREGEGSKLIVGRDIHLKGEIKSCDTLVVHGHVEASMKSRIIEIAESGVFEGEAEIDTAYISGRFSGALTVHKDLVVHSTGRLSGTIRYGTIAIEAGGRIAGDIQALTEEVPAATRQPTAENRPEAPRPAKADSGDGPRPEQTAGPSGP